MASLHQHPKTGMFHIALTFYGKRIQKSLKTKSDREAESRKNRILDTLQAIEKGFAIIPESCDPWEWVFNGGRVPVKTTLPERLTLEGLFEKYEQCLPPGAMEENSLVTFRIHKKYLLRILGGKTVAQDIDTTTMQAYINRRAKEKTKKAPKRFISAATIKKEVGTLSAVWNWARLHKLVQGDAPSRGLRYEKRKNKPGFMEWNEIERRIGRGGLTDEEVKELWANLFLKPSEIAELLEYVRVHAEQKFVYPMFVFVAHTGARRSEMARTQVDDINFETGQITIRERKRDRTVKETTRLVEMSGLLRRVMTDWFAAHPGGQHAFCHPKTLTKKATTYHFKKALAESKWAVVKGFHVFRHSFASNLAAEGIRQEVIDEMMGHQTEEMRRRYRHIFKGETTEAMRRVFGD